MKPVAWALEGLECRDNSGNHIRNNMCIMRLPEPEEWCTRTHTGHRLSWPELGWGRGPSAPSHASPLLKEHVIYVFVLFHFVNTTK